MCDRGRRWRKASFGGATGGRGHDDLLAGKARARRSSDFIFFSRLDSLRALELKELLSSYNLAAVGKKRALVELAGEVLTEHDLDEFIEARSGKRTRIVPNGQGPTRQPTLDALFAART